MRVVIDGITYVPRAEFMSDEVRNILGDLYSRLWAEAAYDPLNESTQKFAAPLAEKIMQLNKILKFTD